MTKIMVLRFSFSTIKMGSIFNNVCQQARTINLKLLTNDTYVKPIIWRGISTNKFLSKEKLKPHETFVDRKGNLVKKKGKDSPKIALVNLDGSRTSMYLNEAEKLAKTQRLDLVEIGVVADKKLYKFLESTKPEPELTETQEKNKKKKVIINSLILENDLITKINSINKMLKKKNEVLVDILKKGADASKKVEMLVNKMKDEFGGDCKIIVNSSTESKCRLTISSKNSISQNQLETNQVESTSKSETSENNEAKSGKQSR